MNRLSVLKLRCATALLAVLGLIVSAPAASAQFSGPALAVTPQANQVQTPTTDPAILNPGARDLILAPGDLLVIHLFDVQDYTPSVRVSVDGSIQLPLIGVVPVAGLTVNQAENSDCATTGRRRHV